jgi:predicted protein tyrosine phosphatase
MKIQILSRRAIEKLAKSPLPEKTAIISISDYNSEFADLKYKPEYLLQLSFDDIDGDEFMDEHGRALSEKDRKALEVKYHMFSDEQANQVANFYHSIYGKAEYLICQCEHGMSRSAAIAAAILEYKNRNGIRVFADHRFCPNKTIFNKVLKTIAE